MQLRWRLKHLQLQLTQEALRTPVDGKMALEVFLVNVELEAPALEELAALFPCPSLVLSLSFRLLLTL